MSVIAVIIVLLAGIVPPFGAIAALIWTHWSGTPFSALGLVRPSNWVITIAAGLVIGVVLKLVMKSLVLPILGAPATNAAYEQFVGNAALIPQALFASIVLGGIGEEIFWRGFLFERLGKLVGSEVWATVAIIGVTSAAFALAHYSEQGIPGIEQALCTGAVFGTLFVLSGSLVLPMVAHATYDLVAFFIIYAGLEQTIAHWFIR